MRRGLRLIGPATRLLVIVATLVLGGGPRRATADEFPARPITLVIPFGPGGASDLTARAFVGLAPEILGQSIVIQLRPGGGGAIGSELVARAKPDGYTLLLGHTNCNSILPAIEGRSRGPDDLEPVARINTSGSVFLVRPDAPFRTLPDLIAWAKANPGQLIVASTGVGSAVDFTWKQMARTFDLKLRVVSHDGGGEALVSLLGGHVHAALLALPQSLPHIRAGTLRGLAYAGARRHPDLPDLPTSTEQGFDRGLTVFKGVMAPPGTPRPVVETLARGFRRMLEAPQVIEGIRRLGDEVEYLGPDDFARFWRADFERYRELGRLFPARHAG
jgi:tripartite-type tricarboxylate transporter receptor subunit TctC